MGGADPPVGRHLVRCTVDPARSDGLAQLRSAHLDHVERHRDQIAYGGVVGLPDAPPAGICYVLGFASRLEVEAFVDADPYRPLYLDVSIEPFVQRLPVPTSTPMPDHPPTAPGDPIS